MKTRCTFNSSVHFNKNQEGQRRKSNIIGNFEA